MRQCSSETENEIRRSEKLVGIGGLSGHAVPVAGSVHANHHRLASRNRNRVRR
jgi:hypothetical protein